MTDDELLRKVEEFCDAYGKWHARQCRKVIIWLAVIAAVQAALWTYILFW